MASIYQELKRRKVFRVLAVYLVAAWLIVQVADVVLPALQMPEWTISFVTVLLIFGFPVALILAWAYEVTPEGIKLDAEVRDLPVAASSSSQVTNYIILGMLAVLVTIQVSDSYIFRDSANTGPYNVFDPNAAAAANVIRANIELGLSDATTMFASYANVAISPDSTKLAYTRGIDGSSYLYVRSLNEFEALQILESIDTAVRGPAFSPDATRILYRSDQELYVIPTEGGTPRVVASGVAPLLGIWL